MKFHVSAVCTSHQPSASTLVLKNWIPSYLCKEEGGIGVLGGWGGYTADVPQMAGVSVGVVVVVASHFHSHAGKVLRAVQFPEVALWVSAGTSHTPNQ